MSDHDRINALKALLKHPSQIAVTAKGKVEYALNGEGPVIMTVHGGPGGYDQGLILGEYFRREGFTILAASRPGYLGTPLETGKTSEEQADALAALIESLGLKEVGIIHVSAGGPPGYLLAARHPGLVKAQVAIDSVSIKYTVNASKAEEALFTSKFGIWLVNFFMEHFPKSMVEEFLKAESTLSREDIKARITEIVSDPVKLQLMHCMVDTMGAYRYGERKAGLENDLVQLASLNALDLSATLCPTLVIHGENDKDVVPAHAEHAAKSIAGAELVWMPKASHLGFFIASTGEEARKRAVEFLKSNLKSA